MRRLPACFELDDLVSEGTLGLIDAATKFDPTRNVPFAAYATMRIRGQILESTRRRHWKNATHLPIDEHLMLTLRGAGAESVEAQVARHERQKLIQTCSEGLERSEAKVIEIYFHEDGKLKGVGTAFGVKQSRSSQLLGNAKRALERELGYRGYRKAA